MDHYCSFPDCTEEAQRYGLCWGHTKQRQRGRPLTPLKETVTPEEAVLKAANDWLEAEEDADYTQARTRVLVSAERWLRARGWRPPAPARPAPCCAHLVQLALPLKARRGPIPARARVEA